MDKRFRIKLKNNRIIGPFTQEEVGELYTKGHIDGREKCQLFPVGAWHDIQQFEELSKYLLNIILERRKSSKQKTEESRPPEPTKAEPAVVTATEKLAFKEERKIEDEISDIEDEDSSIDATRVVKGPIKKDENEDLEKTIILPSNLAISKKAETKEEKTPEKESVDELENEVESKQLAEIKSDDKTEMAKIDELLPQIKDQVSQAEGEFEKLDKADSTELHSDDEKDPSNLDQSEEKDSESALKKRGMRPIIGLVFAIVFYFLLVADEDESEKVDIRALKVVFPVMKEVESESKSKEALRGGVVKYLQGKYVDKVLAVNLFRTSLEYQFKGNEALGFLILGYAELYKDAENKRKAGNVIYKLVEIAKSRGQLLTNVNVAIGAAIFYRQLEKHEAALHVIENYLRVGKPSVKLLAYYLDFSINTGKLDQAGKVYEKLVKVEKLPWEGYFYCSRFLALNERFKEAEKLLYKAYKIYPQSARIMLEYAKLVYKRGDYGKFSTILMAISEMNAEGSPYMYSKYLEYMGVLSAIKGDNETGVVLFKQALKLHDSNELRDKLASLALGGSKQVEDLIIESKIKLLIVKARKKIEEQDWLKASRLAIEAVDLSEHSVPAQILLAETQLKRGFYMVALDTLEKLYKMQPKNLRVNYALVSGYIEALKLGEARKHIVKISSIEKFKGTAELASLNGKFYENSENNYHNTLFSIKWYQESVTRNPLNDNDYYALGRIFLRVRRYKEGKFVLGKAMSLNPGSLKYKILYANTLYELDGVETAIGYLRDLLKSNMDHPKLLSQIAIYYYKSGQNKDFEIYKKQIEKSPVIDAQFYKFLVESAVLENDARRVIENAEKLIEIDPGNLKIRILLGEQYLKEKLYQPAIDTFEDIKQRLPSYPKVNYFLAEAYIKLKKLDIAMKMAEDEIAKNPGLDKGHYIKGKIFTLKEDYSQAVVSLETAISKNLKSVDALYLLGWIKLRQNFWVEAKGMFERVLQVDNSHAESYRELGYVYKSLGQSAFALESFKTYLKIRPNASDKRKVIRLIKALH